VSPGRAKVERERRCRVCGLGGSDVLDAAHVWDRGTAGGDFENEDLIVPLCSTIKGGHGCHDEYDAHKLDLRPYLKPEEQAAAVLAAGSIERARTRMMGVAPAKPLSEYGPLGL
jgi:hypothetical protein